MLSQRILSAVFLAPLALAAVWAGGLIFAVLAAVIAGLMVWEWQSMVRGRFDGLDWLLAPGAAGACILAYAWPAAGLGLGLVLAAIGFLVHGGRWAALGMLYTLVPSVALVWLRGDSPAGRSILIWLLLVVWATDTAAYAAGRTIGGALLAPRISPRKTWAGLIGGMIGAALIGFAAPFWLGTGQPWQLAVIGAALAAVGQAGDLFESWVKRRWGVKDSSALIPGHGGILDRVDGLLAVGIVAAVARLVGLPEGLW